GASVVLDAPAIIRGDRTFVPLRFVAEALDQIVSWNPEAWTVEIVSKGIGGSDLPERFRPDIFRSAEQIRQDAEDMRAYMASIGHEIILRPVAGNSVSVFDAEGFGAHESLMTAIEETVAGFDRLIGLNHSLLVVAMRHMDPLLEAGAFMARRFGGSSNATAEGQRFLWENGESGSAGLSGVSVFFKVQQEEHPAYIKYVGCSTSETVGHELTHAKQLETQITARGGLGEGFTRVPSWLHEGVAVLIGKTLSYRLGICPSYEELRSGPVWGAKRGQTSLQGYTDTVRKDKGYSTAYLAAEFLHSLWLQQQGDNEDTMNFSWVEEYWSLIGIRISPEEAFQRVFGMSLEEFYTLFEQYQQNGYPQVLPLQQV
ncbi:MAG: stalk domain-containing protein, partial [bacterium]|nr:stalk domain-containing protein [bacterium]